MTPTAEEDTTSDDDDISEWFQDRDPEEHRTNDEAWRYCTTRDERDAHVSANLVRWSEMLRLPYFNPIRHLIVDPMHCLFLGIAKWIVKKYGSMVVNFPNPILN